MRRGSQPACKKQTAFLLRLADFRGAGRCPLAKTGALRQTQLPVSSAGRGRCVCPCSVSAVSAAGSASAAQPAALLMCLPAVLGWLFFIYDLNPPGCGALFLLRGAAPACKKQTAAPAPLRLFLPQAAPQLRSPPPIAVPPAACGRGPLALSQFSRRAAVRPCENWSAAPGCRSPNMLRGTTPACIFGRLPLLRFGCFCRRQRLSWRSAPFFASGRWPAPQKSAKRKRTMPAAAGGSTNLFKWSILFQTSCSLFGGGMQKRLCLYNADTLPC